MRPYALALAALLAAALVAQAPGALALEWHGVEVSPHGYIFVYPNSSVRILVNGTAAFHGRPAWHWRGFEGVELTSYSGQVNGTIYEESIYVSEESSGSWAGGAEPQGWGGEGAGQLRGLLAQLRSATSSGSLNYTATGAYASLSYRGSSELTYESGAASESESLKVVAEAVPARDVYLVNLSLNVSLGGALQLPEVELGELEGLLSGTSGVNVTKFYVYFNGTFLELVVDLSVNATPAPPNTTLGRVQALVEAFLQPGFVNATSYRYVNFEERVFEGRLTANVSYSKLEELAALAPALSELARGWHLHHLFTPRLARLLYALAQIASYVRENFQVAVPSGFSAAVSYANRTANFTVVSPPISKRGATSPHQTLAAIDYLIGNASSILASEGFEGLARAVESIDNLTVTVVGMDGVLINGQHEYTTTVGNLSSLTVTVPSSSSSSSAFRAAAITGGVGAGAALAAVAAVLVRRH